MAVSKVVKAARALAAVVIAAVCAGGGHGIYSPAAILFPYTMLSTGLLKTITAPFMLLALLQFPAYGAMIGWAMHRSKGKAAVRVIAIVHALAAIAALFGRGQSFYP